MMPLYLRIADTPVIVRGTSERFASFARDYHCQPFETKSLEQEQRPVEIFVAPDDIEEERVSVQNYQSKGLLEPGEYSWETLESMTVLRKLSTEFLDRDILLFHGSAVAVDGHAYLFSAPSGVGKSTHVHYWSQLFGQRAWVVNDDKPFLKVKSDGQVEVYGSPWRGKHGRGCNDHAPLKALVALSRGGQEAQVPSYTIKDGEILAKIEGYGAGDAGASICSLSPVDAMPVVFTQGYRMYTPEKMTKVLALNDAIIHSCSLYHLYATLDANCAQMAYDVMSQKD